MMRALLWKDLRVNRAVLVFGALLLLTPYVACGVYQLQLWRQGEPTQLGYPDGWGALARASLGLSLLTLAVIAGVAFAAERQDKSAEFLAYMPVGRRALLASKIGIVFGTWAVIWGFNLLVALVLVPWLYARTPGLDPAMRSGELEAITCVAVLVVGAGWLGSSFLESTAIATGMAIFAPVVVLGAMEGAIYYFGWTDVNEARTFLRLCLGLGVPSFVAGCVIYLRKVEP